MKTETITLNNIVAKKGRVFCNKEKTEVFGSEIFLAKSDLPENYIEITVEEARKITEQIEQND
jgi:hypothetical protein